MFKVMIVDDEVFIITLIQKLIDWKQYNMEIVGSADNGITALEEVKRLSPDVIIVDVRMPGYDGITLMRKVREINEKVKFIVVSGHKKFEYAKSAMQSNVEDYLLKPISKDELESILVKLKNKLEIEEKSERVLLSLDNELGVSKHKVRTYFFDQLLKRALNVSKQTIQWVNQTYFTTFKDGCYLAVILQVDARDIILDKSFTDTLLDRIGSLYKEALKEECADILIEMRTNQSVVLLNYEKSKTEVIKRQTTVALLQMKEILAKFDQLYITIGCGEEFEALGQFKDSVKKAENCIKSRIVLGVGEFIVPEQVIEDSGIIHVIFSDTSRTKLIEAFHSFRTESIKLQILEAFSKASEYEQRYPLIYDEILSYLNQAFFDYLCKIDVYKGTYKEFLQKSKEKLLWASTKREMAKQIVAYINSYIEEYTEAIKEGENPAIRIAKGYILENYQSNITMVSVAEIVNLSSVYFSVLFKKEVGINFLEYLNQVRIDMAKKRLRDVKYNINEVANLSGFRDAKYFSKMFKKTLGVTPSEYRNRNVT